jgi:hypothetical protein
MHYYLIFKIYYKDYIYIGKTINYNKNLFHKYKKEYLKTIDKEKLPDCLKIFKYCENPKFKFIKKITSKNNEKLLKYYFDFKDKHQKL